MRMDKEAIEQIVEAAATKAADKIEKRFEIKTERLEKRFERYVGALKEDFDAKLDTILEILPDMQRKLDVTFDKVGEIAVDMEMIKDVVKNHEERLQKLAAR